MKYLKIFELFDGKGIYDIKLDVHEEDDLQGDDNDTVDYVSKTYRYSFITKNRVKYRIFLSYRTTNHTAEIHFDTIGLDNKDYSSIGHKINTFDSFKVFNTIKSIINKHPEIKKLSLSSDPERINFYEKMVKHLKYPYKKLGDNQIMVDLKPEKIIESSFDDAFIGYIDNKFPSDVPKFHPKFWDFVKMMDWKNKGKYDDKYLLKNIAPYYSFEEFSEFEKSYTNLYGFMNARLESAWLDHDEQGGFDVSDDGYGDLISSVIGNGLSSFLKALSDETNNYVRQMAENDDYRENFGYCFHVVSFPAYTDEATRETWNQIYNESNSK